MQSYIINVHLVKTENILKVNFFRTCSIFTLYTPFYLCISIIHKFSHRRLPKCTVKNWAMISPYLMYFLGIWNGISDEEIIYVNISLNVYCEDKDQRTFYKLLLMYNNRSLKHLSIHFDDSLTRVLVLFTIA